MQTKVIPIRATIAPSQDHPATAGDKARLRPASAGLVVFAIACTGLFALLTGQVDPSAMPLLGCWFIGGFVIQMSAALLERRSGPLAGGSAFLLLSAFFMLAGGLEMILKYGALTAGAPLDGRIDGYAWIVLTLAAWLWTPAFWSGFSLLSVITALLDVALPFMALTDLTLLPQGFRLIPAWALLLAAAAAVYLSAATLVNGARGKKVYPLS